MNTARHASKVIERLLFDYYSKGAFHEHRFPIRRYDTGTQMEYVDIDDVLYPDDSDYFMVEEPGEGIEDDTLSNAQVRRYWSMPDSEAVLSSLNDFMNDYNLNDFMKQFRGYTYGGFPILSAKISYPHVSRVHDIPAPHPSMTNEQLSRYKWPGPSMNRMNEDYYATLWANVGIPNPDFNDQNDDGTWIPEIGSSRDWRRILDIPILVGSNRCNLSIMRSYLNDDTWDDNYNMTWAERARKWLEEYVLWEPYVPDGYLIIKGKMKRINITDALMLNTPYVVKEVQSKDFGTKKITPTRGRICEVRSVKEEIGLYYIQVLLAPPPKGEVKGAPNMDKEILKFYNSTIVISISEELKTPNNIFDLVRAYGVFVMHHGEDDIPVFQAMDDLMDMIRLLSGGDREIMRICAISRDEAGSRSVQDVITTYRSALVTIPTLLTNADQAFDAIANLFRLRVLPHCEEGTIEEAYRSKIRFLAIMVINLLLSVTTKRGSKELRMEPTDRKDFSFKRWEGYGHRLRDIIRSMLSPVRKSIVRAPKATYPDKSMTLDNFEKASRQIIDFIHRNQWPTRYRKGGVWKQKKADHKDGIVDDVPKYNPVAMLDSYRTVKINARGGPNTGAVRRVHTSQWGQQCPANTPENANIGLNNNMAEACLITNQMNTLEKEAISLTIDALPEVQEGYLLLVDGNPRKFVDADSYLDLLDARRNGTIPRTVGLARHYMWISELSRGLPVIVVRTSHGRPIVPLIILDKEPEKLDAILNIEVESFQELLDGHMVEFVDSYELVHNVEVAAWLDIAQEQYKKDGYLKYTHSMIKPGHILSQATNCLSFIEHNPAARGTYATAHVKQAIGRPFLHPEARFDHETNYLHNPEPPLVTTDTMRRILYPPRTYQHSGGIQPRDIGMGRNVNIACMSFDGNNDDGIHVSQSMVDSGFFDGEHFNILTSDMNVLPSSIEAYDWLYDKDTGKESIDSTGQGIPDVDFSASIILPYAQPYQVDIPEPIMNRLVPLTLQDDPNRYYELRKGERYILNGSYRLGTVTHRSNTTKELYTRVIKEVGIDPIHIPGDETIQVDVRGVLRYVAPGMKVYRLALAYVSEDRLSEYKAGSINRHERSPIMHYEDLLTMERGIIDTRFIDRIPAFQDELTSWYGQEIVDIPKTYIPGSDKYTRRGRPSTIRPRRNVKRGEVAMRIIRRKTKAPHSEIVDEDKERFEITYGKVDGIERGIPTKIKGSMPLGPKPGNKYAALYAQKGVLVRIVPNDEMPKGRWYNEKLGKYEEMTFDIIFNPLSFPSRGTTGMIYEIFVAGTVKYIYDLSTPDGTMLRTLYEQDRDQFDTYMSSTYDIQDASLIMDDLVDSTCFLYDNQEKMDICMRMRKQLGIPSDGLYDLYLKNEGGIDNPDVVSDLPSHAGWNTKIETKIACGTVYYVVLRHFVDNKRRARGYVGNRDPLTLQPVKGRKRNGGANTGLMEVDAYKGHGAKALVRERLNLVSDHKVFLKCPRCNGLVSKDVRGRYQCVECESVLAPNEVLQHDTVNSWHLFRMYTRALGIEIFEQFKY